jgi:neopullulanase
MRASHTIPVTFAWAGPSDQSVELVGDFPEWKYPVRMEEQSPGQYRCHLELEPGVYCYKYRLNGRIWIGDPRVTVDEAGAFDNGIRVVGGTQPPLLFAPDRRHVALSEDGQLIVHAEMPSPPAEQIYLWLRPADPSAGRLFVPMVEAATRGDWRLLRAEARLAPSWPHEEISFGFTCSPDQTFQLPAPRSALGKPPEWLAGAVFYSIFVDRWRRSPRSAPMPQARSRRMPSTSSTFYGGDLDGIRESLASIEALGANAIILTPINTAPSPHRYDPTALLEIDPAIGGEPALRRLLEAAHARGMKVVVSLAATYVNERHPAFQDLLEQQERSRFAAWFQVHRFPVRAHDGLSYGHYPGRPDLPLLSLVPGPGRHYVITAAEKLVDLGVDGLRLESMNDAPPDFWAELRKRTRARAPELLLLGEVIGENHAQLQEERGVDAVSDYRQRETLLAFFGRNEIDAGELWSRTVFDALRPGPFGPETRIGHLDNHDTARFLSTAVLYDRLRLALAYLYFRPEPFSLLYGTEHALASGDPAHVLDDAWPERLPMPALEPAPSQTHKLMLALAKLRREHPAMRGGELRLVRAQGRLLVVERGAPEATLRAYFNAGDETVFLDDVPAGSELLLPVNDPTAKPASPLPGCSARILALAHQG